MTEPHNNCINCGQPVPINEQVCFHQHENCWVNMLLDHGVITEGTESLREKMNRRKGSIERILMKTGVSVAS